MSKKTAEDVYNDLMQVALEHWEEFTPNPEIAKGIIQFQKQMERWVGLHRQSEEAKGGNE